MYNFNCLSTAFFLQCVVLLKRKEQCMYSIGHYKQTVLKYQNAFDALWTGLYVLHARKVIIQYSAEPNPDAKAAVFSL